MTFLSCSVIALTRLPTTSTTTPAVKSLRAAGTENVSTQQSVSVR